MGLRTRIGGFRQIRHFDNWPQLVINRIFFRKFGLNVYRTGGIDILVDHDAGDESGTRSALISPMYRDLITSLRISFPINVMDLGANGGGFDLLLKWMEVPVKRICAVELNPNTFVRMRFNLERNFDCQLDLHNCAVCGERKMFDLKLGRGGTGDSLYNEEDREGSKSYRIEGVTLDDLYHSSFNGENIDLLKMDVEGAEYEIFDNAHNVIKMAKNIIIEIHEVPGRDRKEVADALFNAGFVEVAQSCVKNVFLYENKNWKI